MNSHLNYPFDPGYLLRKKKSIRSELLTKPGLIEKRIAILGGSTTSEVTKMIELFLLNWGIKPLFYESEYNRYYEDIMFDNIELQKFNPEIIYIHTSNVNIIRYPLIHESITEVNQLLDNEITKYTSIWDRIISTFSCPIIQNNFEQPYSRVFGNMDFHNIHGKTFFINQLNQKLSEEIQQRSSVYLNDLNYLSSWFGLELWYNKLHWYSYKYAMNIDAIPIVAYSISSILKTVFGKTKKCLVLDLDNTLWGGVIGDDGLNGIHIGKETPEAEAFTAFQEYLKMLKDRGVLLAICSKNEDTTAREGFSHPDSILKLSDFSAFYANWDPKHENIRKIATDLNIGIDSIVFIDDNPAERELVKLQEPQVAVIEIGDDITKYISILDKTGLFESISITSDDLNRSNFYAENIIRDEIRSQFSNYDEFLISLTMKAEIKPFSQVYLERITQLTNKTNQFNLTTKRYTIAEINAIAQNPNYISIYGRLIDKFGDNGLVTVIIGEIKGEELHIDLWLMSCRVLKRGMEMAMLDELVTLSESKGIKSIIGYYYRTEKNLMVKYMFEELGFNQLNEDIEENLNSIWSLEIENYKKKNNIITII